MKPEISLNFSDCPPQMVAFYLRVLEKAYRIRRDDRPEYLIYGLAGQRHRLYNCVKIFTHQETYPPDWSQCDYAILPVRIENERCLHLPIFAFDRSPAPLCRGGEDWDAILGTKTRFCALLSNYADRTVENRIRFFLALNRRRKVDSAGRALNNTGFHGIPGVQGKLEFYRSYRFIISFENKDRPGWVTEKIYDPLAVHAVPIYWGDRGVSRYFNPQAYLHASNFSSLEALAEEVIRLDNDRDAYARFIRTPPFPENRIPDEFAIGRILAFFDKIFSTHIRPVTQNRWFFPLTKWRLAKRNPLPGE